MAELREALENAINESEAATATPSQEPSAPVEASTNIEEASAVDASTEESSTPEPTSHDDSPKKEDAAPKEAATDTPAPTTTTTKTNRVDRAPASWKGQAKGEWNNVPLAIRQEVHRREMQVEKVLNETAPIRQFHQQFQQVVTPFQARMQDLGVNPVQAIQNLLTVDHQLSSAPKAQRAQLMAKLIKDYDIDFVELDNALVGATTPQAQQSDVEQRILQQVQQLVNPILQERQQAAQQQRQQVAQTVESMAEDPQFPYFNDVREDMADIIDMAAQKGVAITLQQAYTKAVRMNDDVFQQTQQQGTMQMANQRHQQAQRAKVAASSVTGSPASGGDTRFVGDGSLRGALEAAFSGARV